MESDISDLYDEAMQFYDKNDYENAIIKFKEVVEKNPKHSDAWYTMGLSYSRLDNYKNAIESYQKTVDIDPNYADAWYNMGIVLHEKGSSENDNEGLRNAINCYVKALAIEKKPNYLVRKGLAEDKIDQKQNALKSFEESTMTFPLYGLGWYNKGILLYSTRKFEEAKKSFETLIDLEPNNDNAWYYLGLIYYS